MITHCCSPEVQCIVNCIRNPHEMWKSLETRLDTVWSEYSRNIIVHLFFGCPPKEDEPLNALFTTVVHYLIQLVQSNDAITDGDFCMPILTSQPLQYGMRLMVLGR
jgi:hypothetical protein